MTLEQFIRDYIYEHRSVTFGEVKVAGRNAGYPMDGDLELEHGDGCLWSCMSREFAEAVYKLIDREEVHVVPTTELDIRVSSPRIIISEQPPIPCRLEAVRA
jgi:hypothetical protein